METKRNSTFTASLCGFLLMVSCGGPNQQKTPPEKVEANQEFQAEEYVDPLFEIEGQLCQHVRCIFEDSYGNLWFGTNVYDIMRYDGDSLVYLDEEQGLGGGRINAIIERSDGQLVVSSAQGLNIFNKENNHFNIENKDSGMPYIEIWSLIEDRSNNLWIGTTEGLVKKDANGFVVFDLPRNKIQNPEVQYFEDRITSLMEDRDGNIWVGTDGFGITIIIQKLKMNQNDTPFFQKKMDCLIIA